MPWFKIDDGFPTSKPVLRIPRRHRASAIGLWTLAGAWSAKELTDGHIESHLIEEFGSTPAMARQLVTCGLWEVVENGWNFKHWAKYQPTRDQVMADRDREAERKRAYRASKRSPAGTPSGRTVGHQAESGHPDPTRPDPTRPLTTDVVSHSAKTAEGDAAFDLFWDAYGKKVGRGAAEKAWRKAAKIADEEVITRAAALHADWHKRAGTEARYIPHASKWLNEQRWTDERTEPTSQTPKLSTTDQRIRDNLAAVERMREHEQAQQARPRAIGE